MLAQPKLTLSSKRVAIVQSCYLPWKGYFDLIAAADEFIFYDHVQYTRRDWRNRNKIKTPQGPLWLSIPVRVKGRFLQCICDTEISDPRWQENHWRNFCQHYGNAPYFKSVSQLLEPYYRRHRFDKLSDINQSLIRAVCEYLDIRTPLTSSAIYDDLPEGKIDRLVELCKRTGATEYVSGPTAKAYLDESMFTAQNLAVSWFNYSGYPEYPQLWGEFCHEVSIVDLLFNCGPTAKRYMLCGTL